MAKITLIRTTTNDVLKFKFQLLLYEKCKNYYIKYVEKGHEYVDCVGLDYEQADMEMTRRYLQKTLEKLNKL